MLAIMGDTPLIEDVSKESERVHLLFMQFGVLRKILANLSARDLGRASLVNHAWNNVCRLIRRERRCLHWFEWFSPNVRGKWTRTSPRSIINEEMGRVYCVPHLCLFFSSELINSIDYGEEENKEINLKRCRSRPSYHCPSSAEGVPHVIEHLMKMMPNTCTTLGLRAYGTVGTAWDMSNTVELKDKTSFSVLLVPDIPGVNFIPFFVQSEDFINLKSSKILSDEELESLTGIPCQEQIRSLIFFCDQSSSAAEDAAGLIIQTLLKRMDCKMAVGGGLGDEFFTNASHPHPILMGLAVSGASVRTLSAVIPQDITKEVKIREILEQLKSCGLPSENSVAFMFSCMGRCVGRPRREKGLESTLFREYFPTVPLLGFFGSGEIGFDFIMPNDYQDASKNVSSTKEPLLKKPRASEVEIMHQYSTILVLMHLGRGP
ncbi:F-box only protein 22-like isoform X2 [Ischnura elegans]|uniref:F-box only protein 22-like isoform X2 n=1 Tax=Ischnura elegans TaxID=197161 RepID=UPI001ED89948|nr:F-box only protein 22-like isoform X2 [Ischnura elegans]